MVAGNSNKRPRNSKKFPSDLYRRIWRLLNEYMLEEQAATTGRFTFPSTSKLVDYICEVDRSMQRQKRLQLDRGVQWAVGDLKRQQDNEQAASAAASTAHSSDEEPDIDGSMDFDDLEAVPTMEVKDNGAMNGSLMKLWGAKAENAAAAMNTATTAASTPQREATPDTAGLEKRRADDTEAAGKDRKKKRANKGPDRTKYTAPDTRLSDLGGVDACVEEVLELIVMPLKHPEIYLHTGVNPPRGVLLHGPPGCGKTMLANAIAGEVGVPFLQISAPSIVSGMSGESEKKLREVFEEARDLAPCIVFIDEIDAITPKRETAQREMERRIVAQMLTCIDDLSWDKTDNKPVMLIGATNRPDSLDPALRRAGRFDREIAMTVPDEEAREQILTVLCQKLLLSGDFDIKELAKCTPGYVGADLTALTTAAGMIAVKRIFHSMQALAPSTLADKLAQAVVDGESSGTAESMNVDSTSGQETPMPISTPAR
ncbi:Ribosome biogenesis ATPase rix7, partial [Linderina macrospora]